MPCCLLSFVSVECLEARRGVSATTKVRALDLVEAERKGGRRAREERRSPGAGEEAGRDTIAILFRTLDCTMWQ